MAKGPGAHAGCGQDRPNPKPLLGKLGDSMKAVLPKAKPDPAPPKVDTGNVTAHARELEMVTAEPIGFVEEFIRERPLVAVAIAVMAGAFSSAVFSRRTPTQRHIRIDYIGATRVVIGCICGNNIHHDRFITA